MLTFAVASVPFGIAAPAFAETTDWKNWSYNCMNDYKSPYGVVLTARNCWALANNGYESVEIFYFTVKERGLSRYEPREACEYAPSMIAVDGKRIDLLSNEEQIQAVLHGKTMIREKWERGWPYCTYRDVTISLEGASEVYKRIVKMAPKYLPGPSD